MARSANKRDPDWEHSDSDPSDNEPPSQDPSDDDWGPSSSKKPPAKRQKRASEQGSAKGKQPNLRARITILATDAAPTTGDVNERSQDVDDAVLERIKKALALANHENTGEQEAKQAMRMASKLMSQYSVTQADLLTKEDDQQKLKRAGMSVVVIEHVKHASVRWETWADDTAYAMTVFFDCQSYSETFGRYGNVRVCFYGLAEQTVAAAYAFEMAYNLISRWALDNNLAKGIRGKNLYKRGVAHGLCTLANKDKQTEVQKAIEAEKHRLVEVHKIEADEDRQRLNRLRNLESVKPEEQDRKVKVEDVEDEELKRERSEDLHPYGRHKDEDPEEMPMPAVNGGYPAYAPEDDDSGDDVGGLGPLGDDDYRADFDASDEIQLDLDSLESKVEARRSVKPEPKLEPKPEQPEAGPSWQSEGQLIAFRENSKAIGDEYLKSQGVKLRTSNKRPDVSFSSREDRKLYEQGKRDAAKIDVRRRRLKGAEDDRD
ncbi:hypothetical protein GLOTRDRAFT_137622 [Gloeophyllum trabeum ATCC 11539]|uniref:Uncharacterized protein n=1 Tax=Gloeophyllum trabeum (strain ATCC 11539 / FP-39264 / Madison 617) TaxID=670483 RepID=S7QBC4_GLOTA|nr:uncharacterized protein GLOTRDRAFT_137622 [Gloeophyllum trabeum ATCC 11539]EPQ57251.1 hypothetical protein GLOTRDRAFT_137622 [Gloeophyllum trabeum ATCC 11539]